MANSKEQAARVTMPDGSQRQAAREVVKSAEKQTLPCFALPETLELRHFR